MFLGIPVSVRREFGQIYISPPDVDPNENPEPAPSPNLTVLEVYPGATLLAYADAPIYAHE